MTPSEQTTPKKQTPQKDPLSGILVGFILMTAGVIFYLYEQNVIYEWLWWFLFVIGILLVIDVVIRLFISKYRYSIGGRFIGAVFVLIISGGNLFNIDHWWPFLLIAAGIGIIYNSLRQHPEPPQ